MKYCLSGRQTAEYLKKADEILVEGRDYRVISDYFIDYPDKTIILDYNTEFFEKNAVDISDTIKQYAEISENFVCRLHTLQNIFWFMENGIKFYYAYPVNNYYDMKALMDLGVEYINITAPLTFSIDKLPVGEHYPKFRMVPNVAYDGYIPRDDGIQGDWVRPEDVEFYESAIYIFDFEDINLDKERTLFDIYERRSWKGNLNFLITNLNENVTNTTVPDEFGLYRSTCGQRCMQNGTCHYCETALRWEKTLREYKHNNEIKEDN